MVDNMTDVTTVTGQIIEEFVAVVDKDVIYNLTELKAIIADIYREKNNNKRVVKKSSSNSEDKPKRKPSAYNIYIKTRVAELRLEQPNTPPKLFMSMAASEWKNLSDEDKIDYKEAIKIKEEKEQKEKEEE